MSRAQLFIPLIVAVTLTLGGCQDSPSMRSVDGTVPVSGVVTLDGKPIPRGRIVFIETNAESPAPDKLMAVVNDGIFESEAPPGTLRVEIRSYVYPEVPEGASLEMPGMNARQIIPAQYNQSSELSIDVKESGPNEFSFALTAE